jgi:hypothetical protein
MEYKVDVFPRWGGPGCWRAAEGVVCHHQPGDIQPQLRPLQVQSRGQVSYSCCVCVCVFLSAVLRIRDVYPGSRFLAIPNLGSKNGNKRKGWKKICCHNFLCSHKFHKIDNYFSFEMLKKQIWANFQRITGIGLFLPKKLSLSSQKYGFEIRDPEKPIRIPDPGVKKAPDPGSGSATLLVSRLPVTQGVSWSSCFPHQCRFSISNIFLVGTGTRYPPVQLDFFFYPRLELFTVQTIFMLVGTLFRFSTTRCEKKFRLTSSLAAWFLRFIGPVAL